MVKAFVAGAVRLIITLSFLEPSIAQKAAKPPLPPLPPARPHTPQEVLLLFAGDSPDERIILTLNNNRSGPITTSITAYTTKGQAVPLPSVSMVANESKLIELSPILRAAGMIGPTLGSLTLDYSGIIMEMGAQLTLYPSDGTVGVDSSRSLDVDFRSTERDAVFWLPFTGKAKLSLTNHSANSISVALKCGALAGTAVIGPNATKLEELVSTPTESASSDYLGKATSCTLVSDGPATALRASGVITSPGYSAPIRFL